MGFQEDRGSAPSASQPDPGFVRQIIEEDPDPRGRHESRCSRSVRETLIRRTYGVDRRRRRAIIHFLQLRVDVAAPRRIRPRTGRDPEKDRDRRRGVLPQPRVDVARYRVLPTVFAGKFRKVRGLDYALEVCNASHRLIDPTAGAPAIMLEPTRPPSRMYTPNLYCRLDPGGSCATWIVALQHRTLSHTTCNDRGARNAAAQTSMSLPAPTASSASALREPVSARATSTWSASALNLFSRGVDPELDVRDIDEA